eukprot:2794203-Prymnesium_polylepis.1
MPPGGSCGSGGRGRVVMPQESAGAQTAVLTADRLEVEEHIVERIEQVQQTEAQVVAAAEDRVVAATFDLEHDDVDALPLDHGHQPAHHVVLVTLRVDGRHEDVAERRVV